MDATKGYLIVGGALGLSDGRIDTSGPLVGFCDGGVVSVLTSVGLKLGFSVGECKTDGSELTLGW
eukprot:scaffold139932_cov33-Attheya_sp.AAC.1